MSLKVDHLSPCSKQCIWLSTFRAKKRLAPAQCGFARRLVYFGRQLSRFIPAGQRGQKHWLGLFFLFNSSLRNVLVLFKKVVQGGSGGFAGGLLGHLCPDSAHGQPVLRCRHALLVSHSGISDMAYLPPSRWHRHRHRRRPVQRRLSTKTLCPGEFQPGCHGFG